MSRRPRQNHAAALTARVALAAHQRRSNGGSWRSNLRAAQRDPIVANPVGLGVVVVRSCYEELMVK